MRTVDSFPGGKAGGRWGWLPMFIDCRGKERVDLSVCFHDVYMDTFTFPMKHITCSRRTLLILQRDLHHSQHKTIYRSRKFDNQNPYKQGTALWKNETQIDEYNLFKEYLRLSRRCLWRLLSMRDFRLPLLCIWDIRCYYAAQHPQDVWYHSSCRNYQGFGGIGCLSVLPDYTASNRWRQISYSHLHYACLTRRQCIICTTRLPDCKQFIELIWQKTTTELLIQSTCYI